MQTNYDSEVLIYTQNELKTKYLSEDQIKKFCVLIDSIKCKNEIKTEIKYILEDYNNIIKSHINLLESNNCSNYANIATTGEDNSNHNLNSAKQQENAQINNKSSYRNNNSKAINTFNNNSYMNSLENHIESNNNYIKSYNDNSQNNNNNKNNLINIEENSYSCNYNNTNVNLDNKDICIIKITNDILKNIEVTLKHKAFFANKYNINKNYKDFVNDLITYNYQLYELKDILRDIENKKDYKPCSCTSSRGFHKEENVNDFSRSLRCYPDNENEYKYLLQKPFDRYTSSYGDYFDKETKKISSPKRTKSPAE